MIFFFSSRRRHTRWTGDWSSDVCSSDLVLDPPGGTRADRATLGEQELGVLHQLRVMLHHPRRPDAGAYLLVRGGEENDVPLERHAGAFERKQCHELRD